MHRMPTLDMQVKLGGENPEILEGLREPIVDPEKHPVLVRALENAQPAHAVEIEWLSHDGHKQKNWQQIFRFPFAYKFADPESFGEESEKALGKLLAFLEVTAVLGVPGHTGYTALPEGSLFPRGFMGGVEFYLGRGLEPEDEIALRPLQVPVLLLMRAEHDPFNDVTHHGEWLCETSLQVIAKELSRT